jgi:hypothetical protein
VGIVLFWELTAYALVRLFVIFWERYIYRVLLFIVKRKKLELIKKLEEAQEYQQWATIACELDLFEGKSLWKAEVHF